MSFVFNDVEGRCSCFDGFGSRLVSVFTRCRKQFDNFLVFGHTLVLVAFFRCLTASEKGIGLRWKLAAGLHMAGLRFSPYVEVPSRQLGDKSYGCVT